jgi:FixJ family two-component response regulator
VTTTPITVYIVDDEPSVRQALGRLVQSAGMRAEVFGTVPELAGTRRFAERACIIADIHMPGTSGLELPDLLAELGHRFPVIFVTAYDTEQNRTAAKRVGAAGFFHKPVDGQALLDAIAWAVKANDGCLNAES